MVAAAEKPRPAFPHRGPRGSGPVPPAVRSVAPWRRAWRVPRLAGWRAPATGNAGSSWADPHSRVGTGRHHRGWGVRRTACLRCLGYAVLVLLAGQVRTVEAGTDPSVLGMRMFDSAHHTRVVFDLSAPVAYNLFSLRQPDRLVLDFKEAAFRAALKSGFRKNRRIVRVRQSERGDGLHRVVFDLAEPTRIRSFLLGPHGRRGHRLVLDFGVGPKIAKTKAGRRVSPVSGKAKQGAEGRLRDVVVAVDAGHGGKDSGAIGRRRKTREKDVTLAIARRLASELRKRPGIRPVLIRDGDYYLPLRRRTEIARKHGADLFVSIHADAFRNPKVRGASAYVLSEKGASSEMAKWLAERENAVDRAWGGLDLEGLDPDVQSTVVDMSRKGAIRESTVAASRVLRELKGAVHVHGKHVHRAGFMVLKTRNFPSMLVETAFLSNPTDEKLLRDSGYQQKLARALADGIEAYFKRRAPVGTRLASRNRATLASR